MARSCSSRSGSLKKSQKKSYKQNKFDEHEFSGKSAYFRHVSANNFFGTFFKNFSTDLKSV
jgi:hypothetical protein